MEYVDFGKTGLKVSRLSFGTGTHGWGNRSEQTDLGLEGLANLLRLAYDHGVNFWDSADAYGSHPHVARALQGLPRDAVVVVTKTSSRAAQVTRDVERFLKELRTDVLDVVLLHFLTGADWPRRCAGAMEALSRAKAQGKVRAVGVSCHGLGALRAAAETDWAEVVLARINMAGASMSASPAEVVPVLEKMYNSGKAVYGMKVLGCGQLVREARAAMRYVFELGTVHAITVGTSKREHLYENLKLVEELAPRYPLRALPYTRSGGR
ncbi:MAG: aldo/keto reductase [Anaerolineae bacterium]|jgi:aryl-alcohol dehydrogenase-like predicted oxidoreductase